jgi:hypothetical protein
MDNDDAKHLLLDIRRRVTEHHPFTDKNRIDSRYAMAFGLIIGICTEAVQAVQQNRPIQLKLAPGIIEDGKN